jgi:L-ascorbate metabolism protein UlaG (beta-lactamase superfamily)
MKTDKVCLRPNVVFEPLFNQWYAWPYLISPATAAMYVANQHMRIMQSFAAAPQVHTTALKNPSLRGGPFINYPATRASEVKALLEKTTKEQAHLINFAKAVKELDEIINSEAQGYTLEPLYAKVPDILRGYVELVYDMNDHPSMRLIEGLLYKSRLYNDASQSVVFYLTQADGRPFAFNTPRLEDSNALELRIPFKDGRLDELFKMKHVPQSYDYIKDVLGVSKTQDSLFASFFAQDGIKRSRYEGDGVRVRYFGHACVLIETRAVSILCDPIISYDYAGKPLRFTYADIPTQIDFVLITHNHQDHCMLETLLQLRHRIKTIIVPKNNPGMLADPSLKASLRAIGFQDVREVDEIETIPVEGGGITALPFLGEHGDLNIRTKSAYLVKLEGRNILMAADSNNTEPKLYELLHDCFGDIDALFIGMECDGAPMSWIYGAMLTRPLQRDKDQSRRFDGSNCDKAIRLVERLNPRQVYVYAMGEEPWLSYVLAVHYTAESRPIGEANKLVQYCEDHGILGERLFCKKEIVLG